MLVSKKARESLTTNHDQMLQMRMRCTMRRRFNGMAERVPKIQVDRGRDCDMRQNARYNPVFWWETTRTRPVTINIGVFDYGCNVCLRFAVHSGVVHRNVG